MALFAQLAQGLLAASEVPLDVNGVEHAQLMIEKGPISFVAAVGWVLVILLTTYVVRLHGKSLRRELAHHREVAALQKEFQGKTEEEHRAATERMVKLELTAHGMLEMVEMLRELLYEGRQRRERRKPPTNPGARGGADG